MKPIEIPSGLSVTQRPQSPPWVLYVGNEEDTWSVTELQLRQRFHLTWARDDKAACEQLRQALRPPQVILMGIQLRGAIDGIQLTRTLSGRTPAAQVPGYARGLELLTVPIIFVTADGTRYSERTLRAAGGSAVIHKPVDFVTLSLALTSVHLQRMRTILESVPVA